MSNSNRLVPSPNLNAVNGQVTEENVTASQTHSDISGPGT